MTFPKALSLAALLLACNAMAGLYASAAFAAILETFPASESESYAAEPVPALTMNRTAVSGFSDTLLTLAPEPVRISPLEQALANSASSKSNSVFTMASAEPSLGSLTPPLLETDAQRSLRLAAESMAKAGAVFVPDCSRDMQVRLTGCPDFRPSASR